MRSAAVASLVLAGLAVGAPARAESPREKADALFREGRAAAQAGDYNQACTRFAESLRVDSSTGTLLNLGDCSEHVGMLLAARNYYETAVSQLEASDPRVAQAKARIAALDGRLPRLTVSLAADVPPGSAVQRDGRSLSDVEMGVAVPIDPGEHTLTILVPGRRELRQTIRLREGQSEQVVLRPIDAAAKQPSKDASERSSHPATIGWIAGGIGLAGLAVAGLSGLVLVNEKSTADSGCQNKTNCNAAALSAISANKAWLITNTIASIVAVSGVSFGTYWILTHRDTPARSVGASVSPGGVQAYARVEF